MEKKQKDIEELHDVCMICKKESKHKNSCLYWHKNTTTNEIWVWCSGKCQRAYSIYQYSYITGISITDLLKNNTIITENKNTSIEKIEWPDSFKFLSSPESKRAIEYLKSRNITLMDNLFFDSKRQGIVFPYYFEDIFAGAQIRFINNTSKTETFSKITTITGTKISNLFFYWNQAPLPSAVKYIVITEGAFNAISLQQSLNHYYGGLLTNPFKCIALSGSNLSDYHAEKLRNLISEGYKIIAAPDSDMAGLKMLKKMQTQHACTHYSMVDIVDKDWNDLLIIRGHLLAKYFLSKLRSVYE